MSDEKIVVIKFEEFGEQYLKILEGLLDTMGWGYEDSKKFLRVPFVITSASTLECILNDTIKKHFSDKFGVENSNLLLNKGLLAIPLRGKLNNIVSMLTGYKFVINRNHKVYRDLNELIKLRNDLVHKKSDYESFEGRKKVDLEGNPYLDGLSDITSTSETDIYLGVPSDFVKYYDAIIEFYKLFIDVFAEEEFKGNDLVIKLEEVNIINLVIRES